MCFSELKFIDFPVIEERNISHSGHQARSSLHSSESVTRDQKRNQQHSSNRLFPPDTNGHETWNKFIGATAGVMNLLIPFFNETATGV